MPFPPATARHCPVWGLRPHQPLRSVGRVLPGSAGCRSPGASPLPAAQGPAPAASSPRRPASAAGPAAARALPAATPSPRPAAAPCGESAGHARLQGHRAQPGRAGVPPGTPVFGWDSDESAHNTLAPFPAADPDGMVPDSPQPLPSRRCPRAVPGPGQPSTCPAETRTSPAPPPLVTAPPRSSQRARCHPQRSASAERAEGRGGTGFSGGGHSGASTCGRVERRGAAGQQGCDPRGDPVGVTPSQPRCPGSRNHVVPATPSSRQGPACSPRTGADLAHRSQGPTTSLNLLLARLAAPDPVLGARLIPAHTDPQRCLGGDGSQRQGRESPSVPHRAPHLPKPCSRWHAEALLCLCPCTTEPGCPVPHCTRPCTARGWVRDARWAGQASQTPAPKPQGQQLSGGAARRRLSCKAQRTPPC